jgi:hypothetical protein
MKIALLGAAGWIGRIAAQSLSSRPEVRELLLVDYNIRDAKRFGKALSPKCRWSMADAGRTQELARLFEGVASVANAVGPCAEYEKGILLACAERGTPAASIGDGTLAEADRREIHDAFRRRGIAAVSGCGMMPGWTELLTAHFLPRMASPAKGRPEAVLRRYLFCSLDRFGGYAFFRRVMQAPVGRVPPPPGAAAGTYFSMGADSFGVPGGRPADRFRRLGDALGGLGAVGREFSAAFLYWLRGSLGSAPGTSVAAAGVWREGENAPCAASVEDPRGALAGVLLAEAALRLAAIPGKGKGLLPLPEAIGREEAERIAAENGGKISTSI